MKFLTENLAFFSIAALALALYRLLLFYSVFGIDIANYIDITEVLQAQFFPLFIIVFLGTFFLLSIVAVITDKVKVFDPNSIREFFQNYDNFGLFKILAIITMPFFMLYFIGGSLSAGHGRNMIAGKGLRKVVLVMGKDSIKTDSTIIYVGRTKGYVFLYNRSTKKSRILKAEKVDEVIVEAKQIDYFKIFDWVVWLMVADLENNND